MPLSENKIAEECTEYAILCLRKKKKSPLGKDEMDEWHHCCNGHELGQTLGGGKAQGG